MKKGMTLFSLLLVMMLAMAGCNNNTKTTQSPTPVPSGTAVAEASYLKAGETIKIFQWWNQKDEEAFPGDDIYAQNKRAMVEKLQSEYGITLEFVVVDQADQWSVVRSSAATGTPVADGMHAGGTPLILDSYYYGNIPASILANLTDYEQQISFKDETLFDQEAQQTYCTFDGGLYFFVPRQVGKTSIYMQQACFFNYDLLSGVEPEQIYQAVRDKTWNWEMFADAATKATNTAQGVWGFTRGSGGSTIYNLVSSNAAEVVGAREVDGKTIDRFVMTEEKALKAWEFYVDLYQNKNCVNPADNGNDDTGYVSEFIKGKLAFMFLYLSRADVLTDSEHGMPEGSKFGIVPVPMGPSADRYYAETNWIEPYAMFRDANNPEGTLYVMKQLYKPVYAYGTEDAELLYQTEVSGWCADENVMDMLKVIEEANVYTRHGVYSWTNGYQLLFKGLMADEEILKGSVTASAYYSSIEGEMNDLIDRVNRLK